MHIVFSESWNYVLSFFRIFNLDIFRALILQICIWSIYLVSATPPTVFGESFWNFTVVFRMVWRYAYCFLRILKLFFLHFNLDIFSLMFEKRRLKQLSFDFTWEICHLLDITAVAGHLAWLAVLCWFCHEAAHIFICTLIIYVFLGPQGRFSNA